MSLSIGIIGLPNAGKSTLFNALASRRLAETDIRPFTTIDPHEAVVPVPDANLEKLARILGYKDTKILGKNIKNQSPNVGVPNIKIVPATVTFIDIAGLVKGAHKGEGLGNRFLGKIREVDAIVHVVRAFSDPQVTHSLDAHEPGSVEQILEDIEIVNIELELGGIEKKPTIYVMNVDEDEVNRAHQADKLIEDKFGGVVIQVAAKLEEELVDFEKDEAREYLKESGVGESGLNKLIRASYQLLDLITFYTIKGGREVSAWSLKRGKTALQAAEKVHTDFAKGFIKAEVIPVDQLSVIGDRLSGTENVWGKSKELGKMKLEGKDYIVNNHDVIEFKIGSG